MNFQENTKRIFTAALVVWMSGIVLVFCCQMPTANAADFETESCPLAKKGHCAKTPADDSQLTVRHEPLAFDCCIFPSKVFDKARKLEIQPQSAEVVETVKIAAPEFSLFKSTFKSPKVYQSFIHNRGSTFLHNCVFRI